MEPDFPVDQVNDDNDNGNTTPPAIDTGDDSGPATLGDQNNTPWYKQDNGMLPINAVKHLVHKAVDYYLHNDEDDSTNDANPTAAIETGELPEAKSTPQQPNTPIVDQGDQNSGATPTIGRNPNNTLPVTDDSTGVDDQTQQQAQQQAVPDENEPTIGGVSSDREHNQNNIRKMLQGEGAVNPALIQQINEQARRGLHDTPADTGVYAIHDAVMKHGLDAGAALVQGNRVSYDAKSMAGLRALNGTAQKRPDLKYAIDAANQAQEHMPDGSNVVFSPNGNHGVIAVVTPPGSKHSVQMNLSLDQFKRFLNVGDEGQFDKVFEQGVTGVLQRLTNAAAGQQSDGDEPQLGGGGLRADDDDTEEQGMGPGPKQKYLAQVGAGSVGDGGGKPTVSANKGQGDTEDDEDEEPKPASKKGGFRRDTSAQPDGSHDTLDQDIKDAQRRAYKIFPWGHQAAQRAAFIQAEINSKSENEAKLAQERVKGVNMTDRQKLVNQWHSEQNTSHEKIADKRDATWRYATDAKKEMAAQKIQQLYDHEKAVDARSAKTNELGILKSKIAASGTQGLTEEDQALAKKYGVAADQQFDAGGGNAPKAATPQAGKTNNGQVSLPPVNARVAGQTRATDHQGRPIIWQEDGWHLVNGR